MTEIRERLYYVRNFFACFCFPHPWHRRPSENERNNRRPLQFVSHFKLYDSCASHHRRLHSYPIRGNKKYPIILICPYFILATLILHSGIIHQNKSIVAGSVTPSCPKKSLFQGLVEQPVFLCVAAPAEDPEFTEQIENITVPAGRNVKLACSVKNLGTYKVRSNDTHLLAVRVRQLLIFSNRADISEPSEHGKIWGLASSRLLRRVDVAKNTSWQGIRPPHPRKLDYPAIQI
jgi:hypothetical protein